MSLVWRGAAIAITLALTTAHVPTTATASSIVDARGLAFSSHDAFCRYHCRSTHIAHAYRHLEETSECTDTRCPEHAAILRKRRARRALQAQKSYTFSTTTNGSAMGDVHAQPENKDVQTINVVACDRLDDAGALRTTVSLSLGDASRSAFQGFHDAFFAAYDAMVSSSNATYDACRLQFIEDSLLTGATKTRVEKNAMSPMPMLVRLDPQENELACVASIRSIWTSDDERFTPFLTRSDQDDATSTVMLLHIPKTVADRIVDLKCIASVTQLPAVLKLTPFARASVSISRNLNALAGPALEIRLIKGTDAVDTLHRLQTKITAVTGIQNALSSSSEGDVHGRVLRLQSMEEFKTWIQALGIVLYDDAVEWVDLHTEIKTGSLAPGESFEQRLLLAQSTSDVDGGARIRRESSRRLDAYVQDLVGVREVREKKITGSNIIVGVTDTGLYVDHDQFDQESRKIFDETDMNARKVVMYKAFGNKADESEQVVCGHGTHVSGILAGSSLSKQNPDLGIASSARIAFMDIGKQSPLCAGRPECEVKLETPGEVTQLMKDQVDAGARIFSFSWGTGGNDYNVQSRDLDNYIYRNPEILIIVAAGNSGDKGERTISSPSGAKNVISVGASLNDAASFIKTPCSTVLNKQTVASFSSIGPTLDGRLKPDLVAPGMAIDSAQSEAPGSTMKSSAICSLQGTSQATPVVAGMAVLLYEWLRDGWWKHGVKDPRYGMKVIPAALLKGLIIHSGEKMTRRLVAPRNGITSCVAMENSARRLDAYPDMNQGYGKPTMANIVSFLDDQGAGVYFFPNSTEGSEPRVTEGAAAKFTFMLKERANLRVTLVWTDPAGSVGGKLALQNDLDLSVRVPGTDKVFYPLSGNGTRDSRNNVEMVEVSYDDIMQALNAKQEDVAKGITVEAVVFGRSVKAGSPGGQAFALVASSSPASVETSVLSQQEAPFWQPWMTVSVVVGGTIVVLVVIAAVWRMKGSQHRPSLKPDGQIPVLGNDPPRRGSHAYVRGGSAPAPPRRNLQQPQRARGLSNSRPGQPSRTAL